MTTARKDLARLLRGIANKLDPPRPVSTFGTGKNYASGASGGSVQVIWHQPLSLN